MSEASEKNWRRAKMVLTNRAFIGVVSALVGSFNPELAQAIGGFLGALGGVSF